MGYVITALLTEILYDLFRDDFQSHGINVIDVEMTVKERMFTQLLPINDDTVKLRDILAIKKASNNWNLYVHRLSQFVDYLV